MEPIDEYSELTDEQKQSLLDIVKRHRENPTCKDQNHLPPENLHERHDLRYRHKCPSCNMETISLPQRARIMVNPSKNNWLYDQFREIHPDRDYLPAIAENQLSLTEQAKRRLLEGEWIEKEEKVTMGGKQSGKTAYLVELIRSVCKPPYRYEFIPGRHLVIIGAGNARYMLLTHRQEFPQQLVDLLEEPKTI